MPCERIIVAENFVDVYMYLVSLRHTSGRKLVGQQFPEILLCLDTLNISKSDGQVPSVHRPANCRFVARVIYVLLIYFHQCLYGAQQSDNETNHKCVHYPIKIESTNAY